MSKVAVLAALTFALVTSTTIAPARADQCAWIAPDVARRAAAELRPGRRVVHFCQPCFGARRGPPVAIRAQAVARKVRERRGATPYFQVILDGKPIDLAYVFVERARGRFANLAVVAGCETRGVSARLR